MSAHGEADLSIEPLSLDLLAQVADLARAVYAGAPLGWAFADSAGTVERWTWLIEGNPLRSGDLPDGWVALAGGRLAGHVGIIPVVVTTDGRSQRAAWARDLLVAPWARGQGVGSKLITTAVDATGFLLLGGLNPEVRRLYRRLGYRDHGSIPFYVMPLRRDALVALLRIPRALRPLAAAALRVAGARFPARRREPSVSVSSLERFDERFDRWWSTVESSFQTVVRRTSQVMNWRYRGHPTHRYRMFAAWKGDELRGVAVTRLGTSRGLPAGFLVELLAHPKDGETLDDLVAATRADLSEAVPGPAFLRCNVLGGSVGRSLVRRGFLPTPSPFTWMTARAPGGSAAAQADRARWFLNAGDSDLDSL